MKKLFLMVLFLSVSFLTYAQISKSELPSKKGNWYLLWGWNRSGYSNSDINFKGDDYNFTLYNVAAKDRQSPFDFHTYFVEISLPQTNFRLGYFINNIYDISFGIDHMKYVMAQNQTVKIDGNINVPNSKYNKTYSGEDIVLTEDFLTFEHTDGLNYLNLGLTRNDDWNDLFKLYNPNFIVSSLVGVEAGVLFPKTNSKLLHKTRNDDFHIAGFGVSGKIGVNLLFWKHFFIQSELKGGYINMPDIRTSPSISDKASQHFWYHQENILVGVRFKL